MDITHLPSRYRHCGVISSCIVQPLGLHEFLTVYDLATHLCSQHEHEDMQTTATEGTYLCPEANDVLWFVSGYQQASVVVLPSRLANDFEAFCRSNATPLPLLYRSQPGETSCPSLTRHADIRYFIQHTLYSWLSGSWCLEQKAVTDSWCFLINLTKKHYLMTLHNIFVYYDFPQFI